jgi:sec-independent protein translocase protein TatA
MGGISIWQLVVIAVIVVLLFGTKKLRNLGSDLGSSIKGFKKEITDIDEEGINESKNDVPKENFNTEASVQVDVKEKA